MFEKEPVVVGTSIGAAVSVAIMAIVAMLVSLGVWNLGSEQVGSIRTAVEAVVALVVLLAPPIVGALWARGKVTPVAAPKTKDGQPAALVPIYPNEAGK